MQLTKRNHYTPCFWAALWSETYYRSFLAGALEAESVRDEPHSPRSCSNVAAKTIEERPGNCWPSGS